MTRPKPLQPGDTIAILSPASAIDPALVRGAADTITALGYRPLVMPHALGRSGTYSASASERLADMTQALTDPSVRAILCSRGGYGAVHLLPALDGLLTDPKWLIGFSDITALHALWARHGIVSIHSSMAKQLALGTDTEPTLKLFDILTGGSHATTWTNRTTAINHSGTATGRLVGGNLAVLDALAATPYYTPRSGDILFIEDIAEPIYKVERILWRMRLSGLLDSLGGLIIGRFTEYNPDRNYDSMEAMIADMTSHATYPVAFDAPIGHIGPDNLPILHGAIATLT
ncbi:MAG: LD-carboxypeptidase, partial [Muribaculaceae bacterium]|nr:LD-carboxypeptidase [Muribaculaceae bacterium]